MKILIRRSFLTLATLVLGVSPISCQTREPIQNPEAVGKIKWGRDYDTALAQAKTTGKPIFLLFQEVPGCAGCRQFGRDVLSDPEVVKSVEENFVPLLIPNNQPGKDAEILKRFKEPAWNYQVVRFLDAQGHDLIPRQDRVWETDALKARIALVLKNRVSTTKRVAIAQYCFWEGEMKIGGMEGVTCTEAGYIDGKEVTLVDYDPAKLPLARLTEQAKAAGVGSQVFSDISDYQKAPASDQKRQLQGTNYAGLKLTPEQATKVNAFVRVSPERAAAVVKK